MAKIMCFLVIIYQINLGIVISDITKEPGHLKRFGTGRPIKNVDQMEGFPFTQNFFNDYVKYRKPLLMQGAANMSRAFQLWTDDYFSGVDQPEGHQVVIQQRKKENRQIPRTKMAMKEFVKIYNDSDLYMINPIPQFLEADVLLPGSLQCPVIQETILEAMMWLSSGGTATVVHFDSVDLINCVIRGQKEFMLVEPNLFGEKVGFDHAEKEYSAIDVDRMDYLKYPGLAEIEYYRAFLDAGDCLYIPYRWVHQVRSYNSNVAVNIWWDAYLPQDLDLDQCPDTFDPELTIDKVKLIDYPYSKRGTGTIRDSFLDWTRRAPLNVEGLFGCYLFIEGISETEFDILDPEKTYKIPITKIFYLLDQNNDDLLEYTEVQSATEEMWKVVTRKFIKDFEERREVIENKWQNQDKLKNGNMKMKEEL